MLDRVAAAHFFRLVCDRYERRPIVITSNKRFAEWGALFGDETLAAAILDRLLITQRRSTSPDRVTGLKDKW